MVSAATLAVVVGLAGRVHEYSSLLIPTALLYSNISLQA